MIKTKFFFVLLVSLFVFTTASGYDGVSGTLVEDYGDLWGLDATIHADDFSEPPSDLFFQSDPPFPIADGSIGYFEIQWGSPAPASPDQICGRIIIPACDGSYDIPFIYNSNNTGGYLDLGTLNTGTGPNAIVLRDLTATSPGANPWLAALIVAGTLALVSGGLAALRKGVK